ncbi:MAG: hypothetical protein CMN79_03715 [Spirochaetales bacterium]|nr:hypothetical protein [Spirochaetales bacterium]
MLTKIKDFLQQFFLQKNHITRDKRKFLAEISQIASRLLLSPMLGEISKKLFWLKKLIMNNLKKFIINPTNEFHILRHFQYVDDSYKKLLSDNHIGIMITVKRSLLHRKFRRSMLKML